MPPPGSVCFTSDGLVKREEVTAMESTFFDTFLQHEYTMKQGG
jgi:hypothetical protein